MKISIITVALNEVRTIQKTLDSVAMQSHPYIEHIIIDGGSTDGTFELAIKYANDSKYPVHVLRQTFPGRIYGALNEGISYASGDIIATLHANDYYPTKNELTTVAKAFREFNTSIVYGNIYYVTESGKRGRTYSAKKFHKESLLNFFAPPHPAIFIKRELFNKYGGYSTDYLIAGDFEFLVRILLLHNESIQYINNEFVAMLKGGLSTSIKHRIFTNMQEKWAVLKKHNQSCSIFSVFKRYILYI